jgi:hypothetical protein
LEHVKDDQRAMTEVVRVLRPGGWAILQSPIDPRLPQTFEDPAITSSEERERTFGQWNHVRIYGRDYELRLRKAGFTVRVDSYVNELPANAVSKYGLPNEDIYFCTKPLTATVQDIFCHRT